MRDLTERQERILEFFEDFLDEHDYPPTVRDIQRGCEISSTSVVSYNIDILKREGLIRKHDGVSRGLGLVVPRQQRNVQDTVTVPLVGSIAAGEPFPLPTAETWASAADLETIDLPQPIAGREEGLYALNVRGESMIDALIADGDLVIMQQTNSVPNGEMAAVRIAPDDETTLKRIYAEGPNVRLQPENSQMGPIIVEADKVEVLSRVVAVWRYRG